MTEEQSGHKLKRLRRERDHNRELADIAREYNHPNIGRIMDEQADKKQAELDQARVRKPRVE